jgi:general secretion pathway protein G
LDGVARQFRPAGSTGYTLLELVITLTVLAILVMGTIPMAQNAVKRDKEVRLREALREMRAAFDEFKRDAFGACPNGSTNSINPTAQTQGQFPVDPRSRVVIDDCKIFNTDNIDRYPPSLDQLVQGVSVKPRSPNLQGGRGLGNDTTQATDVNVDKEVVKVYLREIPVDPMTGEKDWNLRSSYQQADSDNWDEVNVFDVRSASKDTALNGEKYSDW